MTDDSVIVVGAGTVGLVTALGLARAGIPVRVLEAAPAIPDGARDMVYNWAVLDGLARLGVLPDAERRGLRVTTHAYRVRKTGETIWFDLSALEGVVAHPFNLHVGQGEMTRILLEHLARYPAAEVQWGTSVVGVTQRLDGVTVICEASDGAATYSAGWIVGADGARSIVRRELGLGFAGMTWPDRFVAINMRFDFGAMGFAPAAHQIDPVRGAVVAQVDKTGLWRYIYAEHRTLPEESIGERVRQRLCEELPDDADPEIQSFFPYRIHERSADRYRVGRAVLVGDAAHLTNPTRALGMTSGLFDAYALTEALVAVLVDGHDDEILDRYSLVRRRNFLDLASPISADAKEFVFPFHYASGQEVALAELRATAADPVAHRAYLLDSSRLGASSLLGSEITKPGPLP
jgi:3-(3-hydroxy-phenyl)propionate hydroxylase/6-hydroxy-3-succinoylpyridine 3-monooxygenase